MAGIALADLLQRDRPTTGERRLFVTAGLIAASAPDVDLVYTWITRPPPIGFLLHHRGHTHTILGLCALGVILVLLGRLLPAYRHLAAVDRNRLWMLLGAGLGSHLFLDAFNSYGVHPFYPLDVTWYFGDSVFIFEPWLWLPLGAAVAWSLRRATRLPVIAVALLLPAALAAAGIIPPVMLAVYLAGFGGCVWVASRLPARTRAVVALVTVALLLAGMFGLSRIAREATLTALQPELRGEVVDIILTPNPASPSCWSVIAIEKDEPAGEFVLWSGTLSLLSGWKPPTDCASHRLNPAGTRLIGGGRLALREEIRQPLQRLRDVSTGDCRIRAWLQFGRAPVLSDGQIFDLRFEQRLRANFSTMPLGPQGDTGCPSYLPGWAIPRADLLTPSVP